MTDLLTKEERETVEEAKEYRYENEMIHNLIKVIDNLSKRGVKKYSAEELRAAYYAQYPKMTVQGCASEWVKCARFLGALEEK